MRAARNGANKGSPDLPLARTGAGNARVRRGMIQLAWRFPMFQKESALSLWYRAHTADSRIGTRKTRIPAFARTALAHKLLIALCALSPLARHWRASSCVRQAEGPARVSPYLLGPRAGFSADCRVDDPRWREAVFEHGTRCRPKEWPRRPELPHGSKPVG